MRIPDETLFGEERKKLEDSAGWRLCTQCDKCALTHINQIFIDGFFYCMHLKAWKQGDDLLEYECEGYRQKTCYSCASYRKCRNKELAPYISFCNGYVSKRIDKETKNGLYFGRRHALRTDSINAIEGEEYYISQKKQFLLNSQQQSEVSKAES